MWAVLRLVSVDVLTLAVKEIEDGQRVSGKQRVYAEAFDNQGGRVVQVQVAIDDVPLHRQCGNQLDWSWDTAGLVPGPHIVDVVATNAAGKTARRRLTVFTGDHFITRVGSRYEDGGTVISFRNLSTDENTVKLSIFDVEVADGVESAGKLIVSQERDGRQGAMRFWWDGKSADQKDMPLDRYVARLDYIDPSGSVRHSEQLIFVHDTPAAQQA
jgi:squalene-hopene/tetraprenyl-beta-curcumene cyclase